MLYLFALARLRPLLIHRARQRLGAGEVSHRSRIACTEVCRRASSSSLSMCFFSFCVPLRREDRESQDRIQVMHNEYDRLASDYHWLVEDDLLSGEFFLTRHRSLLDSLSPDARILDCACGIGSDAIGLARCGYQVAASDQSASFVAEAERRARAAAVNIRFVTCQWD